MATTSEVLVAGDWTIAVVVRDGRNFTRDHFVGLDARIVRKAGGFLDRTARVGPLGYSEEKNRKLAEHIFELKPTKELRLLYFFDGAKRLVITHAFTKKQAKTPRGEIRRAMTLRTEYMEGLR